MPNSFNPFWYRPDQAQNGNQQPNSDEEILAVREAARRLLEQLKAPGEDENGGAPSQESIDDVGTAIVFLLETDLSSLIEKVQEVRPDDGRAAFLECAKSFRKRAQEGLPILEDSIEYILAPILGLNRDALIEEVRLGIRQGKIRTRDGLDEPGE